MANGIKIYGLMFPKTVAILAFVDDDKIILERQYRGPINKYLYEIPAGHVDPGESPKQTAMRELKEETGYTASKLSFLARYHTAPGIINELQHLYLAKGLKRGRSSLEPDEYLTVKIVPMAL